MEAGPGPAGERRFRRAGRWTVLAVLSATALILGVIGFERLPEGDQWSFGDSLHRSVQLFVLESGGVAPPVPWQLEIARILAPATTVFLAVLAILAVFRDELRELAIRLRARDHVIIAGLGGNGFRLARRLHEQGQRVVAIERDANAPAITGGHERGMGVIVGDAADPRILEKAALARARQLFVLCGDDGVNADVALAARRAAPDAARGPAAYVQIDDLDLWRHLKGHELATADQTMLRTEFFNIADVGARLLLDEHPPFEPGDATPHVLVCGAEGIGESVVLHTARRWLVQRSAPDALMRITLCGPDAAAERDRLLREHPRLLGICDLRTGDPDPDASPPSATYVCMAPEGRAVSLALKLRPAVVTVRDETEGIATAVRPGSGVTPFGVLNRALSSSLVLHGTTEVLARAKHDQYVRDEHARGRTLDSNPSLVPWHELEGSLRESNRHFAEGVGAKLRAAGIALLPAPLADPDSTTGVLPEAQVEELAIAEHDRWCQDLLADGWRHSDGPKDPERKLHPSLVPWERLSEAEREKDREPVRALPEMLARAGFELRATRAAPGATAPDEAARTPLRT